MARKLTEKQEAFIREYVLCGVGSEAMRRAGYTSKNENVDAAKLLANPSIKVRIDALLEEKKKVAEDRFAITQERILRELAILAFGNIAEIVDDDGNIIDEEAAAYLSSISKSKSESFGETHSSSSSFSYGTQNKTKALELLGKHVGLWSKPNGSSGTGPDKPDRKAVLGRLSELYRKRRG